MTFKAYLVLLLSKVSHGKEGAQGKDDTEDQLIAKEEKIILQAASLVRSNYEPNKGEHVDGEGHQKGGQNNGNSVQSDHVCGLSFLKVDDQTRTELTNSSSKSRQVVH